MGIHSFIKLIIFSVLISVLSCTTAPKVTDVAELHYGDNEADIVEKFGRGSSVLYYEIKGVTYHYRSYTTKHTEDDYALLFADGVLLSVSEKIPLFENCITLNETINWEECLLNVMSDMRGDARMVQIFERAV